MSNQAKNPKPELYFNNGDVVSINYALIVDQIATVVGFEEFNNDGDPVWRVRLVEGEFIHNLQGLSVDKKEAPFWGGFLKKTGFSKVSADDLPIKMAIIKAVSETIEGIEGIK